ncbi:protein kinase [Streptomyces noursei]|uniref:protein kinase domain-containing protein n=1 Tax=Streptomyces noursei TaxID=1971 RepID=UPI0035D68666
MRTTASLHEHPGITAVHDAGVDPETGRLYVVMQLLKGREFQTLIDETDYEYEPIPIAWAAAVGAQIASTLDEVHRHGVVHRDIKPANLILTPGGVVKVLDFGVAALLGAGTHPHLAQEGMAVGTPAYMSPEQSLANTVGPAADVYALACVLYQLLTGRTPFTASDQRSHTWHHVHTQPPSVRTLRADVPPEFERLLLGMMAKEAEQRMSALTVYETLFPLAAGGPPANTPPLLTSDRLELDPCAPFLRPFGGPIRRAAPVALAYSSTHVDRPKLAEPEVLPLTETEADEAMDHAGKLVKREQFTQAADLLAAALARSEQAELNESLNLSLAHVKYLAGAHHEAVVLFDQVAQALAKRYGATAPESQQCGYFAAQCRMEMGESTVAIAAFEAYAQHAPAVDDPAAVDRHLEALAQVMRLEAAAERFASARAAAIVLRSATRRFRGDAAPELDKIDGFIRRLAHFEAAD